MDAEATGKQYFEVVTMRLRAPALNTLTGGVTHPQEARFQTGSCSHGYEDPPTRPV